MSNVNRPVIPAEVADIIEEMRKIPYCNNRDITNAYDGDPGRREKLRAISFDTLLAALVNGYERELSEEEKRAVKQRDLAQDYSRYRDGEGHYEEYVQDYAFADGIKHAINMLGVKIEGVNA
ncbi:hypothetical protein [Paenibacillus sp. FSL R5-0519]|uniref:hypothetical protein n=1 Tax=Paenibacillus sp. FSL R5-0519 TaxID=2921648 RepID=UPI0030DCFAA5